MSDVLSAIKSLKNGKAAGLDNLSAEYFKYADDKLSILLSFVLNAMVIHNYIPDEMLDTIIVPLIKDKNGNVSDRDNYRPLALTCVASKLFEFLILHRFEHLLYTTANQFGFKRKLSTDMCIFSLKQVIEYYNMYSSPVYMCFLDASKAFDKLNHWHLFSKLLDRGMPRLIVSILLYLYTHQKYCVRWQSCFSESFHVTNGVPQGRILSPFFFNVYMDDLSVLLSKSYIGCNVNGVNVNHLFYADDAVLLASSPSALQKLLNICSTYADMVELKYNAKKTKCMVVKCPGYGNLKVPQFTLGHCVLNVTECTKYLGCFISNDLCDDSDIKRQIRCIYTRGNILISKFKHCSDEVKSKLFKSYCSSFYGLNTWSSHHMYVKKKLIVAYKKIFRAFFNYKLEGTTYHMLQLNISPFNVIERNCLFGFINRLNNCDNIIVSTIVNAMFYKSTSFYRYFMNILY